MGLYQSFYFNGGGFISFEEDGKLTAFMVHGKDQARNVLLTRAYADDNIERFLATMEGATLPENAVEPVVAYQGSFIYDLCEIITAGYHREDGEEDMPEVAINAPNELFLVCIPVKSEDDGGILLYADATDHRIAVVYSRAQFRQVLAEMTWLKNTQRSETLDELERSVLPEETTQQIVRIDGTFAALVNTVAVAIEVTKEDETPATSMAN